MTTRPTLDQIIIDSVRPSTTTGAFPAKAVTGEVVPVSADIFKDGHDELSARVRWHIVGEQQWQTAPLTFVENDIWRGTLVAPDHNGMTEFVIEAWLDEYKTWEHKAHKKLEARVDISVEIAEGILFFEKRAGESANKATAQKLLDVARCLADDSLDDAGRLSAAFTNDVAALVTEPGATDHLTSSTVHQLWVDRPIAGFGSWYCAFPRSWGGLQGLTKQLDYISDMKFDVLYLTPVHPIGHNFRKGKNNTLTPTPDDVGVPYAIGNADGGHLAVAPEIGTIEDFDALVERTRELGMEIAMDNALQCSPDHPWVTEHPEWFNHRPDGTIAYAENPPKKYQDIYPINFWPAKEADRVALWEAAKETFTYWIGHGVKIFRVDNPHTKPMAFWSWCIETIQRDHPDVIFLSEAFTRPKVMAKLAEVGFSQSYTYFTWRNFKDELMEYGTEVSTSEKADFMRPNFWPNTHDLLTGSLRNGPVGAFKSRLVLAATMVPSYGIYSGYELQENEPLSDANTDYMHSEKYEIRERDFNQPHSLAPYITTINAVRREHVAMQDLRNLRFHHADNDAIVVYSRVTGDDVVIVVVNLDPHSAHETNIRLDMAELGFHWDQQFEVYDELTGRPYTWGESNYVWLGAEEPAHLLTIRR